MSEKKHKKAPLSLNLWLTMILIAVILVSLIISFAISKTGNDLLSDQIAKTQEYSRPAGIELVIINEPSCEECYSLNGLVTAIKQQNINIIKEERLSLNDKKAQELIKQYSLTKIPVLLAIGEITKDESLQDFWKQLGRIEDETFILTQIAAPYVSVDSGEVQGKVQLTMITDESCEECYQVSIHEKILKGFGLPTNDKIVLDIQSIEGEKLIKKYDIKIIPTIILTGDIDPYSTLTQIWSKVGTVEDDGAYVFRDGAKNMGAYKDLSTGKILKNIQEK